MSYYHDITDDELQYFHNLRVPNFTIKLSDILHQTSNVFDNKLFKIEEIVTDSIYRIFPIFYTGVITSTNPDDQIIDDKVLICTKLEKETYVTFISDESEPVQDYSSYGSYFSIGDSLTTAQFNGIVQLLRANTVHKDEFELHEGVTHGNYADYELTIDGLFVDNGIEIVSFTDLKMKLLNPVFKWSTYTLKLKALRITNPNVESDDSTDGKTFIDVSVDLTKDSFVSIPTTDLLTGDIILYDAIIEIKHDKPVIRYIYDIEVTANPSIIQSGDNTDIFAQLKDSNGYNYDINDASGKTVYFYEALTPTINVTATPSIIQTGGTTDIYATVKDEDGSIPVGATVNFYKAINNVYMDDATSDKSSDYTATLCEGGTNPSMSFSSNKYSISGGSKTTMFLLSDIGQLTNCTISLKVKPTSTSFSGAIGLAMATGTGNAWGFVGYSDGGTRVVEYRNNSWVEASSSSFTGAVDSNGIMTITATKTGNSIVLSGGNGNKTLTLPSDACYIGLMFGTGSTEYYGIEIGEDE